MGVSNKYRLRLWLRYDGQGNAIAGSEQWRPIGTRPMDGNWKIVPNTSCCSCDCIITFFNNSANTTVTAISSADGNVTWTGILEQGDYKSFVIPNCYDETYTMLLSTPSADLAISGSTTQGDGVIVVDPTTIANATVTPSVVVTTTATICSEYIVQVITD